MGDRLTGLDALRGIAAVLIFAGHLSPLMGVEFGRLYLAVDFFFVLSGYVMARAYEPRIPGARAKFLAARIKRLWPLMALGALLGIGQADSTKEIIFGLAMIPVFTGGLLYPLNGPAWSILFELFANLAHAAGLDRIPARWLFAIMAFCFSGIAYVAVELGTIQYGAKDVLWWFGFPRVLFSYLFGICLYRLWREKPPLNLPAGLTCFVLLFLLIPIQHWAVDIAFILIGSPLLIAGGLNMGGGRFAIVLGAVSYPLYALHIPLRNLWIDYIPWQIGVVLTISVVMAVTFAVPYLRTLKPFRPERAGALRQ